VSRLTKELLEMARGMHASGIMSKRAFHKIAEGLREALSVARGKAKPAKLHMEKVRMLLQADAAAFEDCRREVWIRLRLAYLDELIKRFGWKRRR
jgi:hypothetical protein